MEHRKVVRYPLEVPAVLSWKDERGVDHRVEGRTRDISTAGAYVFATPCPPPGSVIGLDFLLAWQANAVRALRLRAEGKVVRVETAMEHDEAAGFAVSTLKASMYESETGGVVT